MSQNKELKNTLIYYHLNSVIIQSRQNWTQTGASWCIEWHAGVRQLCRQHQALYGWYHGETFASISICNTDTHSIPCIPHYLFSLRWISRAQWLQPHRGVRTQCQAANENCHFPATTKLYFIPRIENRHESALRSLTWPPTHAWRI